MDIDFGILKNIFTKKEDIKNNLTSTDTDKPLSANQGRILDEIKINSQDYLYIDTVNAEVTYDDDSTDTIPFLADIREVNDILKVAIIWDDDYNRDNTRPSSVNVRLLRDGLTMNTYVLNSDNNWQYKVNIPFDDGEGHSYDYTWSVSGVSPYNSDYTTDGNLWIINMILLPSVEDYEF